MQELLTLKQVLQKADELSKEGEDRPLEMHVYCTMPDRGIVLAGVHNVKVDEFGGVVFELVKL